jgi:hypothetical protein
MKNRSRFAMGVVGVVSLIVLGLYAFTIVNQSLAGDEAAAGSSKKALSVFMYDEPTMLGFFDSDTGDMYIYHQGKLLNHLRMEKAGEDLKVIKAGVVVRENGKVKSVAYPDGRKWSTVDASDFEILDDDADK